MAKFRVEVNGTKYQVEAPNEDTAWEYANDAHYNDPEFKKQAEKGEFNKNFNNAPILGSAGTVAELKKTPISAFTAATGTALAKPYQFFKQALGFKNDPADVMQQRELAEASPGGALTGDLAAFAIPGGKAEALAQGAIKLSKLPAALKTAASYATTSGTAAGMASLQPTLEGESKWDQVKGAAALGPLARAGLGQVSKVFTGMVNPSKDAEALMQHDIQPTVAGGGEGLGAKIWGTAEKMAAALPFGGAIKKNQQRAEDEFLAVAGGRASPTGVPEIPGRKGFFDDLTDEFDQDYTSLLTGQKIKRPAFLRTEAAKATDKVLTKVPENYRNGIEDFMERWLPKGPISGMNYKAAQDAVRAELRLKIKTAERTGRPDDEAMVSAYQNLDDVMAKHRNKDLTPDIVERLNDLDQKHKNMLLLERSENSRGPDQIQNLINTVERETPRREKILGSGSMQDLTEPAKTVFKVPTATDVLTRKLGYGVAAPALGGKIAGSMVFPLAIAAHGMGRVSSSREGSKFLMGKQNWQGTARELEEYLRDRTGAIVGAEEK